MAVHDNCVGCSPVMRERDVPAALRVSRRKAQLLIASGDLHRMRRGVVVGRCLVENSSVDATLRHRIAITSLLLTYDDAVASHESAALVRGLPLLDLPPFAVATRARGAWRGGPDARIRIAPLPPHHVVATSWPPCTNDVRTFVDVAKTGTFRGAVVIGDALLRDRADRAELDAMLDECSTWADLGKARRAAAFLDPRSESPLESVSRAIMHEYELPPPELQVSVDTAAATYRLDFLWRQQRVIGEADGLAKYADIADLRAEKVRQERLEGMGFAVVRWTWREMLVDTDGTIARIRTALDR